MNLKDALVKANQIHKDRNYQVERIRRRCGSELGAVHPFKWPEPLDVVMRKWKAGYYLTLTHDADTYALKNAVYWQEGKDVFPKSAGSGKSYAPRNEKPMIFESVFKSCCDCARLEEFKTAETYEQRMDRIWAVAKKISLDIVRESGA